MKVIKPKIAVLMQSSMLPSLLHFVGIISTRIIEELILYIPVRNPLSKRAIPMIHIWSTGGFVAKVDYNFCHLLGLFSLLVLVRIEFAAQGVWGLGFGVWGLGFGRSEEHTSELQSQSNLVYRLLLEKK